MSDDSVQKWLEKNRPPRVKITYEVHTGGAIERRELPFIVGVFADLTGDGTANLPKFKDRQMLPIDRDNFDDVLKSQKPTVNLAKVPRTVPSLKGEPAVKDADDKYPPLGGAITFRELDDFEPVRVVKAVPEMHRLYRIRGQVRALQARAETSTELADALDALFHVSPEAAVNREKLEVLVRPPAATSDAATAAKMKLASLVLALAPAADDDARVALLQDWNIAVLQKTDPKEASKKLPDPEATIAALRKGLGLFGSPPSQVATTLQQLRDLKGANKDKLDETPSLKPLRDKLGLSDANFDELHGLVDAFLTFSDAIPADDKKTRAWADQTLSVIAGLQRPDDELPSSPRADAQSEREHAELTHEASNRYFATTLLLRLVPPKPGTAQTPSVSDGLRAIDELLDAALPDGADATERLNLLGALGQFVGQVLRPQTQSTSYLKAVRAAAAIDARVASIDKMLSGQLSAVMHSDGFRAMEATWRGLHYLVSRTDTGKMLKLRVFNARWQDLLDDMEKAVEQDQSHLFKMIYEAEYGTLGGDPYSMLVGGYEIGRSAQEIEFLHKIAAVAASAHAPFITAAAPSLFGLETFGDLARPRDLEKIFEGVDLAAWQEFRASQDSRYVSMVLPHVLLRLPYGSDSWPVPGLGFEEDVGKPDSSRFLWGNAAYMLAERITHAFSLYSWTAAIRGVEGGGLVTGLPLYAYDTGDGTRALFCPTEVSITDRREKELNDLGFISLCHCKGKGEAAFFGGQTTNLPKKYNTDEANENAKLSALLPYMLAASRFAHYIKVIMRDKVGSFLTRGNVEAFLNTWITQYVLLDENAMQEAKAAYPLSQASIVVKDVPGDIGNYNAIVFLRPHFQLEELTTSIRLVAKVPA